MNQYTSTGCLEQTEQRGRKGIGEIGQIEVGFFFLRGKKISLLQQKWGGNTWGETWMKRNGLPPPKKKWGKKNKQTNNKTLPLSPTLPPIKKKLKAVQTALGATCPTYASEFVAFFSSCDSFYFFIKGTG